MVKAWNRRRVCNNTDAEIGIMVNFLFLLLDLGRILPRAWGEIRDPVWP